MALLAWGSKIKLWMRATKQRLEIIEHDHRACINGSFVSVDTYDILTNNEFPIFDIWEKIFMDDDAWVGVILVNGGYGDATNEIHDVWNVTLIGNVLFIRDMIIQGEKTMEINRFEVFDNVVSEDER
ncbi:hypothetical protein Tco_1062148 [Tanacetum coccineum]